MLYKLNLFLSTIFLNLNFYKNTFDFKSLKSSLNLLKLNTT